MSVTSVPAYEMIGDWAVLAAVPGATSCWVHNAIVATSGGELIGFHGGRLVAFDTKGPTAADRRNRTHRRPRRYTKLAVPR